MKTRNNRNRVIWKWSLSYFGIVLLPVLFGGILYVLAMGTVEEKSEELHRLLAQERGGLLARSCEELDQKANQIFSSSELAQVSNVAYTTEQKNYYAKSMQALLKRTAAECDPIDRIVLYLPQNGSFLSESWQFPAGKSDVFFERKTGLGQEYFYWLMAGDFFNKLHIYDNGKEKPEVLYIRALSNSLPYQEQRAIMLLYLNRTWLETMPAAEGINFYLEDSSGNSYAIVSGEEQTSVTELQEKGIEDEKLFWIGETGIFRSSFEKYGLSVYQVQPEVAFIRELRRMKQILLSYCVLGAIVGFLLTYLRSRKNYQPINSLVALLEKTGEKPEGTDTWSGLQASVRSLSKKYREGLVQQRENDRQIEEERLRQVLLADRSFSHTGFEQTLAEYGQPVYRVVHIDTFETENGYQEIVQSAEDIQMLHFIIDNVMTELLEGNCCCEGTTIDNELYFLLQYDGALPEQWDKVQGQLELVREFFKSSYAITVLFHISEELLEADRISDGLQEVRYLAQFRNEFGSDKECLLFDDPDRSEVDRAYIKKARTKLAVLRLLKENQLEEAANVLRRQFPDKEEKEKKQKERRKEADDLVEAATDYIQTQYTNPQLTAGYLAEQLGVHSSKLSREFKQRKETGVLEYIGLVRLEAAKRLLEAGNTVGDTAVAVGYYNSRPLIRLFQEHEGITPSQYKK